MAVTHNVAAGMRVTHTVHGDGLVRSVADRTNPITKVREPYATVHFPEVTGAVSWAALSSGRATASELKGEGLTVLVPVADLAASGSWYLAEDYGDLSDLIVDIERLATKRSSLAPPGSEPAAVQGMLLARSLEAADLSPSGDPVNALKVVVDWSVDRLIRQISAAHKRSSRVEDAHIIVALAEQHRLWSERLFPGLPEHVRAAAERVLLSVAALLANWHDVDVRSAAGMVTGSIENRVTNLHIRSLRLMVERIESKARTAV